ncbi:hypothetical protein EGI26_07395 [Lacihabitans sp. CCS-44]|nr:hypothetical protein [Lacihabitans sp. CCS-44]
MIIQKLNLFNIFWGLYLFEFITPFVLILNYLTGIDVFYLIKITPVLYVAVIFIFHLKNVLILKPISILFIATGILSIFLGIFFGNSLDYKFLMHVYYATIPIIGISFGYHFARSLNTKFYAFLLRIFNYCFYLTLIVLLIYFYFHFITGQISYWGFGTDIHILLPFLLNQSKYTFIFLSIVFVLLSGKRATTLNIFLDLIIYYSAFIFPIKLKSLLKYLPFLIALLAVIIIGAQQGAFVRLESSLSFNSEDEYSTLVATGGRWQEVLGIIEHHSKNPIKWLIGAGFGGRYLWEIPFGGYSEIKHYAHFTPIAYIFIFGIPFTAVLYIMFIKIFIKGWVLRKNPFFILFCVSIFGSFFGANLLVDIKIWVFVGIAYYLVNSKEKFTFIDFL